MNWRRKGQAAYGTLNVPYLITATLYRMLLWVSEGDIQTLQRTELQDGETVHVCAMKIESKPFKLLILILPTAKKKSYTDTYTAQMDWSWQSHTPLEEIQHGHPFSLQIANEFIH